MNSRLVSVTAGAAPTSSGQDHSLVWFRATGGAFFEASRLTANASACSNASRPRRKHSSTWAVSRSARPLELSSSRWRIPLGEVEREQHHGQHRHRQAGKQRQQWKVASLKPAGAPHQHQLEQRAAQHAGEQRHDDPQQVLGWNMHRLVPDGGGADQAAQQQLLHAAAGRPGHADRQRLSEEAKPRSVEVHIPEQVGVGAAAFAMKPVENLQETGVFGVGLLEHAGDIPYSRRRIGPLKQHHSLLIRQQHVVKARVFGQRADQVRERIFPARLRRADGEPDAVRRLQKFDGGSDRARIGARLCGFLSLSFRGLQPREYAAHIFGEG